MIGMVISGMPTVGAENITDTVVLVNESFNPVNESTCKDYSFAAQPEPYNNPLYRYFPDLKPQPEVPASDTGSDTLAKSLALREGSAQPAIMWQKTYGGSKSEDEPGIVRRTMDGGYIATVTTLSSDGDISIKHAGSDIWVVKLDESGFVAWEKARGGSMYEMARDIQPTSDGGYIIAGTTNSQDGDVSGIHVLTGMTPVLDIWVAKLDSAGNIEWQRCLGGIKYDYPTAIRQTPDGGYIVAGYSDSGITMSDRSDPRGLNDAWVVKLSESGGFQWERSFGGASHDYASSVSLTSDGGYIISGYTESDDAYVTGNHGGLDAWVIKLYSTGTPEWQKCYGGSASDAAYSIQQTPDGGYIVAGGTSSTDGDVSSGLGASDAWVLKLDSTGAIVWEKTFGGSGGDFAQDILRIPGGGYMVAAQTQSVDIPVGGYHGGADILVGEFDDAGTLLRELCLGGTSWDVPGNIILAGDGDYLLGGVTYSNNWDVTFNHGMYDLWIVKHGEGIPVHRPELVVEATDSATSALIPGATISLFDVNHGEWQNVTAGTGSYTFTSSGSSQQYALVPGTAYRLAASADGYSPAVRNVTFGQDGQRETVILARIEPEVFTFSMTNTFSKYAGKDNCDNMAEALKGIGWGDPVFYNTMESVTKSDFGVNPSPNQKTLNDAVLHYHVGHGGIPYGEEENLSGLGLLDQPGSFLSPSDVEGKWGNKNKWVILHSCYALVDDRWGKALSTSHGVLGFKTMVNVNPEFTNRFFHYAIDEKESVYDAFKDTTYDLYKNDPVPSKTIDGKPDYSSPQEIPVAAVVFGNINQAFGDHLPDIGTGVTPDSLEGPLYRDQWRCNEDPR